MRGESLSEDDLGAGGKFMVHRIAGCGFAIAYIIEENDGLLVVDAGSRGASRMIIRFIRERLGRSEGDIKLIAATHFHIDHISGIRSLLDSCGPSTKVLFHYRVRDYLQGAKLSAMRNWLTGMLPASLASLKYLGSPGNIPLGLSGIPIPVLDGLSSLPFQERIMYAGGDGAARSGFGFSCWEIIETPGHTEDSVSFYNPQTRDLVCGDFILNFTSGGRGRLNRFHWDAGIMMQTFMKIRQEISPERIHPGHGEEIHGTGNALAAVEPI